MAQRPPRDVNWIPDDSTGISVPGSTKQNAGWIVEKPPLEFLNWMWNRVSRWFHYLSGQSQEYIVIDSANANEKDYDTLADYIADAPAAGDKVLIKETQVLTAQMVVPSDITVRLLDGIGFTRSTLEAVSVIKFGSNVIIEGILNLILSQTGTTAVAVEYDGDNTVGKINVENSSTGILTTAHQINASKSANKIDGIARNTGGGTLTNINVDNSGEDTNRLAIFDEPNNTIVRSLGSNTFFDGFKFALSSDADGDIYYRDAGILKRLAKGTDEDIIRLKSGIPSWETQPLVKILNIGNWNMISTASVNVAHGLTQANIRQVTALIRNDDGNTFHDFGNKDFSEVGGGQGAGIIVSSTNIALHRGLGGEFVSAQYDNPSFDRGWIVITYVA